MSTYLSTTDVFLAPTPEIRALHEKSILIVTPSGDKMWAKICVEDADPEGRDGGNAPSLSGPPRRMNVSGLTLARVVRLRRQNRIGGHSFLHRRP
jgi:hypothetical protein